MNEGQLLGFDPSKDRFVLLSKTPQGPSSGTGEARVEVAHDNKIYLVQLIQPVKQGQAGIWVINTVALK